MANKVKNSSELQLVAEFDDGDTRTIKAANPTPGITKSEITPIETAAAGVLIGDKNGAEFSRIASATIVNKSTTTLDLNII